ncbi:MAG: hypothetical protein EBR82_01060 [Caulobacteraceae bacterium]|nr:hypothetical protein [Caulobacteraceae bacterium]
MNDGRLTAVFKTHVGWTLTAIAVASLVILFFYPRSWVLLESGRLLLWPKYAVAAALLGVWLAVWVGSLKRDRASLLVVLATLAVTALPLLGLASEWGCVAGGCYW